MPARRLKTISVRKIHMEADEEDLRI